MKPGEFTAGQHDFLSRFFGPGNMLRWDGILSGTMPDATLDLLLPLIDDLRRGDCSVLLPHVSQDSVEMTTWYGLARDARQSRALKEELMAFLGPTYTDFTGQRAILDERDPVEAALIRHFGPYVFRLRVLNPQDRLDVRRQIERLRFLRGRHPDRSAQPIRPIGRILRDLEMAILVRNEAHARQHLEDLRARGRLSAQNLLFLHVRILAAFEHWSELRNLATFQSLLDMRRPTRVTEALIRCVYNERFTPFEVDGTVADCIALFREKESTFGTLFRARGSISDPEVLKAWLLRAVAREDYTEAEALLAHIPEDHRDRRWAELLANHLKPIQPDPERLAPPALELAQRALDADNLDAALGFLIQCEPTVDVIRKVIDCAEEISSLDAIRQVILFVEASPEELRHKALSWRTVANRWNRLIQPVTKVGIVPSATAIPDGWDAWLQRLNTEGSWPEAVEIAKRGSEEWLPAQLHGNPFLVAKIADQLTANRSAEATAVVHATLPHLMRFFLPEEGPVREFKPVYMSLIWLLALDAQIGADDLAALEQLAEAALDSAPSIAVPNDYSDLLESLEAAWQQVAAVRHLDWALSVLDLLIAFNANQHAPVVRFLQTILGGFRDWSRRVREDQWHLVGLLASDLGQSELYDALRPVSTSTGTNSSSTNLDLKGKSVAIYTLTERIGQRAAQLIQRAYEGVKVHLLHDKAASDRLIQHAGSADIFIVNTWDAKHAATGAIQAHRSHSRTTLFPPGKSAASILNAIHAFASVDVP